MNDAQLEIEKLKEGQSWIWPESDYGRAEIWLMNGVYFLFSIPMYGGCPVYEGSYKGKESIDELVAIVDKWA
jgi:hypothetical protein